MNIIILSVAFNFYLISKLSIPACLYSAKELKGPFLLRILVTHTEDQEIQSLSMAWRLSDNQGELLEKI